MASLSPSWNRFIAFCTVTCTFLGYFEGAFGENPSDWKLIFATNSDILMIASENGVEAAAASILRMNSSTPKTPIAVDCDVRNKVVYWTDVTSTKQKVVKTSYESFTSEVIVDSGLGTCDGIAYDWITGNVYITDVSYSQISVCRKGSNLFFILVKETGSKPRSIALNPDAAQMYWTDWGSTPSILRAGMDGSNKQVLISTDLKWPNGFSLDLGTTPGSDQRMYWVDAFTDKMESAKLDGSDRRLVYHETGGMHPFGFDIFGDRLFWSDWNMYHIKSASKADGSAPKVHFSSSSLSSSRINDLAICDISKQPVRRSNPCSDANCSHLCVLSPPQGHRCICPAGLTLSIDERTCDLNGGSSTTMANLTNWKLVFATNSAISMISSERGVEAVTNSITGQYNSKPIAVDCDAHNKVVYWTDVNIGSEKIMKTSYESSTNEIVVDSGLGTCDGIAYDWITGNVYVTDVTYSRIFACGKGLNLCSVLLNEANGKPRSIALHPNAGKMYWTDWGSTPSILRAGMDGSQRQVVISTDLKWPNGFSLDLDTSQGNERMYWADAHTDKIESAKLDGSDRKLVSLITGTHPFGFDVGRGRIFWSDWTLYYIKSASKTDGSGEITHVHFNKSLSSNRINGLSNCDVDEQPMSRQNPCTSAKCSHLCVLSSEEEHRCICPVGMSLSSDGITCTESITTSKLIIASGSTVKLMRFGSVGKDILETIRLPDVREISAIIYNPINNSIIVSDKVQQRIYEYDHIKKEERVLVQQHIHTVTAMDIDIVSENLYWIDKVKRTVEVMSLRTLDRLVLRTGVDNPLDILVVPQTGSVYLSSFGLGGRIEKIHLSGSSGISSFSSSWISGVEPVFLSYHKDNRGMDVVLWADRLTGKVGSSNFHGLSSPTIGDFSKVLGSLSDAASHDNKVYWLDSSQRNVKYTLLNESKPISTIPVHSSERFFKLTIFNANNISNLYTLIEHHECSWRNPRRIHCPHLCLPTGVGNKGVCRCPEGLVLNENTMTCNKSAAGCSAAEFTCKDGSCIPKTFLCDSDSDCDDGEDELNCHSPTVPPNTAATTLSTMASSPVLVPATNPPVSPSSRDEINNATCSSGMFTCNTTKLCIAIKQVCNTFYNCPDQSDEDEHLCTNKTQICSVNEFKCGITGTCVNATKVCDGFPDCKFGEDEADNCSFEKGKRVSVEGKAGSVTATVTVCIVFLAMIITAAGGYAYYRKKTAHRLHIHTVPYVCSGGILSYDNDSL